jgi:nicotinate phosphoribosyltransferase
VLDFSLDIVEIEGKPISKKGKPSGRKQVWRCRQCLNSRVVPWQHHPQESCECGGDFELGLEAKIHDGIVQDESPSPQRIRNYVIDQLRELSL